MKDFRPKGLRSIAGLKQTGIYRFAGKVYHDGLLGTKTRIVYRAYYFSRKFDKDSPGGTIFFLPDKPDYSHVLYKICNILGYAITSSDKSEPDLVVAFEDTTKRADNPFINEIAASRYVVNKHCDDVSKVKVEEVFRDIFGYGTLLDPKTHHGLCVMKSNENATHDGKIVECPVSVATRSDVIYQKMINNAVGNEVLDIRVPIIGEKIPFIYLKYRGLSSRFSNMNARVTISSVDSVLSGHEVARVLKFAKMFGLDFGELDVLRDSDDGKIYIIDVNNTPCGPPNHLSKAEDKQAIQLLSNCFNSEFLGRTT